MITVPETVEELVKHTPFFEEGLALGIINLFSLARKLQPQIRKKLYKEIQTGAIIMALKRLEDRLQKKHTGAKTSLIHSINDLTVHSNLTELTFTNSPALVNKQRELLAVVDKDKSAFLAFTHGTFETTLIISSGLKKAAEDIFKGEILKAQFDNLSSVTLILSKETVYYPGVYYVILKVLAWQGINLIEVISSFTELTIILENHQVNQAFAVLKNLNQIESTNKVEAISKPHLPRHSDPETSSGLSESH